MAVTPVFVSCQPKLIAVSAFRRQPVTLPSGLTHHNYSLHALKKATLNYVPNSVLSKHECLKTSAYGGIMLEVAGKEFNSQLVTGTTLTKAELRHTVGLFSSIAVCMETFTLIKKWSIICIHNLFA